MVKKKIGYNQVSERANISRPKLLSVEKGNPNVNIGACIKGLFVLRFDKDIIHLAKDHAPGRRLQEAKLLVKEQAPKARKEGLTDGNKE